MSNILKYIGEKRVHRFVIVEDETIVGKNIGQDTIPDGDETVDSDATPLAESSPPKFEKPASKVRETKNHVKDRLVGMLSLSDIMKHIVGTKQKSLQGKTIVGLGINEKGKDKNEEEEIEEEDFSLVIESEDEVHE